MATKRNGTSSSNARKWDGTALDRARKAALSELRKRGAPDPEDLAGDAIERLLREDPTAIDDPLAFIRDVARKLLSTKRRGAKRQSELRDKWQGDIVRIQGSMSPAPRQGRRVPRVADRQSPAKIAAGARDELERRLGRSVPWDKLARALQRQKPPGTKDDARAARELLRALEAATARAASDPGIDEFHALLVQSVAPALKRWREPLERTAASRTKPDPYLEVAWVCGPHRFLGLPRRASPRELALVALGTGHMKPATASDDPIRHAEMAFAKLTAKLKKAEAVLQAARPRLLHSRPRKKETAS